MKVVVQYQLKLILRPAQERMLNRWLWHLTGVYNWALTKIEKDAELGIYHTRFDIERLVRGHGAKLGIPQVCVGDTVRTAHDAWKRCYGRLARRPRLKGRRNRLSSIPCHYRIPEPSGQRISFPGLPRVKFHAQDIPAGVIKCGRIVRRASGWYLCLFIDAGAKPIPLVGVGEVGIDPGFSTLLTFSSGEKIEHPHELRRTAARLTQAQRGRRTRLVGRLKEREANQRKDRNHKLSRRLVADHQLIAWSKDRHVSIARTFGKSVASAAHGQLREMLRYKCRAGGREFIEVSARYSTVTCSVCGARSGPSGFAGLKVRQWMCGCGASLDRDCNAAENTLRAARGMRVESGRKAASGIAT